jgi:hypothetical protein
VHVEVVLEPDVLPRQRVLAPGQEPVAPVRVIRALGVVDVELVPDLEEVPVAGEPQEVREAQSPVVRVPDLLHRQSGDVVELLALIAPEQLGRVDGALGDHPDERRREPLDELLPAEEQVVERDLQGPLRRQAADRRPARHVGAAEHVEHVEVG